MISRALALMGVFSVAACAAAAPPLDLSPTTKADDQWAPPVVRSEAAPLAPALGEPIELAKLVEDRLRTALIAGDTRLMDDAANRALRADRAGDRQEWDNPRTGHRGEIILASRDAMGDGRVCAILHHTHVFASQTIRGSLTLCRRAGEPWEYENMRWLRTGGDLVRLLPGGAPAARAIPQT